MIVLPFFSRIALVGRGSVLLPAPVFVAYSHTTVSVESTSTARLLFESVISVFPLGRRLAKATPLVVPPAVKVATMLCPRSTSIARSLFSSAMRMFPLAKSSALLGSCSWLNPLPATPVVPYCQTLCLFNDTSITRWLPWSVVSTCSFGRPVARTRVLSWSSLGPVTPHFPYCHTLAPSRSTRSTRLSPHPFGQRGSVPGGAPVPAMSVSSPTRWASL